MYFGGTFSHLKMAEQLSAEDFTEFIDPLCSIVKRTASVYRASDHVGLEICARKLEEHTRILITLSLSQNSAPLLQAISLKC